MEKEYSKTMRKLKKRQPNILTQTIIVMFMLIFAVAGFFSYKELQESMNQPNDNMNDFEPKIKTMGYSKLNPEFLSEGFASNYNDSILYCFAIDKEYNPYVVAIREKDIAQYQDLIDYTYDESIQNVPAPVTLVGTPMQYDEEMMKMTIDAFHEFWGSDTVDKLTFRNVFGNYYLDTTQYKAVDYSFEYLMILSILVLGALFIFLSVKAKRSAKRSQITLDRYNEGKLKVIDQELSYPTTIAFQKQNLYFTQNYIVSGSLGFDIIPYEEIVHVYGDLVKKNRNRIMATTKDGDNHVIAEIIINNRSEDLYREIIDHMKKIMPDIQYGFDEGYFSKVSANNILAVDEIVDGTKSNMLLGIIGAILGAALGGVIWIIIGKLGFIAGIAGYAMMYFAIKGYRKFSGSIDKKGQNISLLVAFLMIFAANYTSYALEYCKHFYSGDYSFSNLLHSYSELFGFMNISGIWGDFLKDLAIGYALSIWAGINIIKSVFSKKN